jgi:hypothetical protein
MKDEIYKKVYIKSEADLPKEKGTYIVSLHPVARTGNESMTTYLFNPNNNNHINSWQRDIDWYLQPIEQPKTTTKESQVVSAKQIQNMRNNANDALELTKGFTPEQRKTISNWIITLELLAGHIMYLTDTRQSQPSIREELQIEYKNKYIQIMCDQKDCIYNAAHNIHHDHSYDKCENSKDVYISVKNGCISKKMDVFKKVNKTYMRTCTVCNASFESTEPGFPICPSCYV